MRLHLVVLIALGLSLGSRAALAGGPIVSGTTVSGTVSGPSFIESWTFTGTAGNRVIINAVTTSGSLNTNIVLKAPSSALEATSSGGDQLDWQLAATGTYTIEVQDVGLANAGTYAISLTNLTAGPLTGGGDTDGGPITSADVKTGTISGPADIDAYTFSGQQGSRILVDAVATAGPGFDTVIFIYPPNGASYATYVTYDRLDLQLTATGTWTIVIEDYGVDTGGSYSLSFLNVTQGPLSNGSDTDGGTINSDEIKSGQLQQGVDFDAYTFYAFAGNRILATGVATGGGLNTNLSLYPPGGGAALQTSSGQDFLDVQVLASGVYTLVVEDVGNDTPGNYTISVNNVTGGPFTGSDPDGGLITSASVVNGTISGTGDEDVFTFSGTYGDRVLFDLFETGGAGFNAQMILYPPGGGSYFTYTSSTRLEAQLNVSGTWSVVIQDIGFDTAGSYAFSFMNVTSGPLSNSSDPDGGTLASNQIKTGTLQQGVDFDAFTFTGVAGHRVILTGVTTGGGAENTDLYLYPPGGGSYEASSSSDALDVQLAQSGTYTLVVADVGSDNTGPYTVSMMDVTSGPYTSGSDPDGGAITSAAVKNGTMSGVGDLDVYTFSANAGDRVLIDGVTTSGALAMYLVLYPPNGGSYYTYTAGTRIDTELNQTGTWSILLEDSGWDTPGSYSISLLNVTSGPLTSGTDTDGGAIVSDQIKNGNLQQGVDFDAYTFTGVAGHRVLITGVSTGGGAMNTNLSLYPPGGGSYEASSTADYLDTQLATSGTYTIVMEDAGNNDAGPYTVSMVDITAGPYTDGSDPDGGPIASSQVKTGTTSGVGDIDAYTFSGTSGQRVLIDCVETGGSNYVNYIVLYPPNGGSYLTYSGGGRLDAQLTATGTWTVLIYDNGFDNSGSYEMSFLNVTGGPLTNGGDADGGAIVSNEIKTGTTQQGTDFDAYTFSGTAGQRVIIVGVATSANNNTSLALYPPGGGPAETYSSADRLDWQLLRTGTYTIVVEDYGNDNPGTYTLSYVNLTAGPYTDVSDTNGGPLVSNQVVSGTTNDIADIDAYQFTGTYGERWIATAVATGGVNYNTYLIVYPPNGGPALTYTGGDQVDFQLNATGVWTLDIEDNADDNAGSYTLSLVNLTHGPYSGSGETDGGAIKDNVTATGSIYSIADVDAYTFFGITGRTANITATTTSGLLDTNIILYPPGGGSPIINTSADTISPTLTADGFYTVVVEDYGADNTGGYHLTVHQTGTGITGVGDTPPAELALHPGVPSPFSQSTRVDYDLPRADHVRVDVYDVKGTRIRTLVDTSRGAGRYGVTWDGRDESGARVASGVYYLRMETKADTKRQKIVLIR